MRCSSTRAAGCLLLCLSLLLPGHSPAGGGPQTMLLVVNAQSPLSLRIANAYIRLRQIPETHVLWLEQVPAGSKIPIELFRKQIWQPISEFLQRHRLEQDIDAIVYSADFPYAVDFSADLKRHPQRKNRYIGRYASLTSLTYYARRVAAADLGYLGKNHYFRDFAEPPKKTVGTAPSGPVLSEKQVRSLRRQARGEISSKKYRQAAETYRSLLRSYPHSAKNWHDLARALAAAGDSDQALTALNEALDRGWTNSLETRHDKLLGRLQSRPEFEALIGRMESAYQPVLLSHGFRSRYVWSNADLAFWDDTDAADQYYLSTMLAYTGIRGNSFPEVMRYLRSAAASDGSNPDATVYLMENKNIRSKTRQHLFPAAVRELNGRGRRAEILSTRIPGQTGILPVGKTDIIGLVVGSPSFAWAKSGSRLLPGAIAESLTSYGGDFDRPKQTKLTEFLRQGAAGSSGAVTEPYSIQQKFPVPLLHGFYADGCSLAEAFYQSIEHPYQLIVVGDPLARPFARFANISLAAPDPAQPWSGTVELRPEIQPAMDREIERIELWVDGSLLSSTAPGAALRLNTRELADGHHDLRLVAVEDSHIETRSDTGFTILVKNGDDVLSIDPLEQSVRFGDTITITGNAPDASRLALYQGHRKLSETRASGGRWSLSVASPRLGLGAVSLHVLSQTGAQTVRSPAVRVTISESDRLPPFTDQAPANPGFDAMIVDRQGVTHQKTLTKLKGNIKPPAKKSIIERVSVSGLFKVDRSGFHQLVVGTSGQIRLSIDGQKLLDRTVSGKAAQVFVPVGLEAGWHLLEIELTGSKRYDLKITLAGDQVSQLLEGEIIGH